MALIGHAAKLGTALIASRETQTGSGAGRMAFTSLPVVLKEQADKCLARELLPRDGMVGAVFSKLPQHGTSGLHDTAAPNTAAQIFKKRPPIKYHLVKYHWSLQRAGLEVGLGLSPKLQWLYQKTPLAAEP